MDTNRTTGDIWDVPQYPQNLFDTVPVEVWREAEPLLAGYSGKCTDACQLSSRPYEPGWLNASTGSYANELGAPVGQAVNVVLIRQRGQCRACGNTGWDMTGNDGLGEYCLCDIGQARQQGPSE